jgi:uncharacterized protein YxjI
MQDILSQNVLIVKEHLGIFKAANNYDIYSAQSGELLLECREPNLGPITKLLRFTDYKQMTPFDVQIRTPQGNPFIRIQRGISIFLSKVAVTDENNHAIGGFQQKLFSIGGKFDVLDSNEQPLCQLNGKLLGWNFHFMRDGVELAHVSKKWGGIGKELFTSADNYVIEISDALAEGDPLRKLVIAAVMCIDMVLKE